MTAQAEVAAASDEADAARREGEASREHAMASHEAAETQRDHVTRFAKRPTVFHRDWQLVRPRQDLRS